MPGPLVRLIGPAFGTGSICACAVLMRLSSAGLPIRLTRWVRSSPPAGLWPLGLTAPSGSPVAVLSSGRPVGLRPWLCGAGSVYACRGARSYAPAPLLVDAVGFDLTCWLCRYKERVAVAVWFDALRWSRARPGVVVLVLP